MSRLWATSYHSTEYVVITGTNCDVNWNLGKTGQLDEKRHDLENAKDKCAEVKKPSLLTLVLSAFKVILVCGDISVIVVIKEYLLK